MNKLASLFAIVLATACGGGTGDGPEDTGADAGVEDVDTTSPSVVSISPADGETGVRNDVNVVIKFSEAMDQLSVQNSIDSGSLGAVSFAWSDGGSTLEIRPANRLAYAQGAGVNPSGTEALSYDVILGTGATDEAGNAIDAGAQSTFTTLKSISLTLVRENEQTGTGTPEGVITDADDLLTVGDEGSGALSKARRGYITIDMSSLPETAVEIVSAALKGQQLFEVASVYEELGNGSGLLLEHSVFVLGVDGDDNAAFNAAPLSLVGDFAQTSQVELSTDVTAEAQDDLVNRDARLNRSQYRLRFDTFTNLDDVSDLVLLSRDEIRMDVVYLAP